MGNEPTIVNRTPPLCDDEGPIPTFPLPAIDPETGQLLPMSDQEREARRSAAIRTIKALGQITDESDTDETWDEVFRSIDENRPHRPLFKGMY